jgi:chromosome partitioning protein
MSVALRAGNEATDSERENVMSIVWAIANQKGGVGKSTVAVNLAAVLGSSGCRTLVCDLDPQGNAGDMLGANIAGKLSLCHVFEGRATVTDARLIGVAEGVDLVSAGEDSRLSGVEQGLVRVPARERWLSRTLDGQVDEYEYVILDCPPGLGQLTTNALVAADRLIAPVRMTDRNAVKGLNELFRSVVELREVGFDVAIPEVLRVAADDRLLTVQSARQQLAALSLPALATEIPKTEAISNAVTEGLPIVLREPRHDGARAFVALAHELVPALANAAVAA